MWIRAFPPHLGPGPPRGYAWGDGDPEEPARRARCSMVMGRRSRRAQCWSMACLARALRRHRSGTVPRAELRLVRRERRELHAAVGSERCAGQSPTASHRRARAFETRLQLGQQCCLRALGDVRLAGGQDHRHSHERRASSRQKKQLPYFLWADGTKVPTKVQADNYGHGSHARYNSWVILIPATGD